MRTRFTLMVTAVVASVVAFTVSGALVDQFTGATYYVDSSAAANGNGSAASPFQTIQAAVDAAAPLSVIEIAPGEYAVGAQSYALGDETTLSRVVLTKKLYLKGAGRDKTFIIGAKASVPDESGNGADAVRCLLATAEAEGSLIEGLTLKGGRTAAADATAATQDGNVWVFRDNGDSTYSRIADTGVNTVAKGGGAFAVKEASGGAPIYLVDVTVDDCQAGYCGGGLYGNFVLIRCLVKYCRGGLLQSGAVAGLRGAFSSIFTHCGGTADGQKLQHGSVLARARAMNASTVYVNCTMASNRGQGLPQRSPGVSSYNSSSDGYYNCAFFDSHYRFTDNQGLAQCNCVMNTNGSMPNGKDNIGGDWGASKAGVQYWLGGVNNETGEAQSGATCDEYGWDQLVSMQYDFRPRANAFILDKGAVKWLTTENKATFVPDEYLSFDFKGDPRTSNNGTTIAMGAYEKGVTLGVGYTVSDLNKAAVNGYTYETPLNKSIPDGLYGEPYAVLEVTARNGQEYFGLGSSDALINVHANSRRYVFPQGYGRPAEFMIRPSGTQYAYTFYAAASVKWVDPVNGVDDPSHGSEGAPYRTLQYAHDQITAPGVLVAKPGDYAEGEGASATDNDWIKTTKARLTINRNVRVCSTGGADVTFIHGRSSTDDEDTGGFVNDGCGVGALRCIMFATSDVWPAVQGFTLTGGRTDSDPVNKQLAGKGSGAKTADDWQCYNWSGAGVCGWSWYSGGQIHIQVMDCVVTDCVAYRSVAGCNAFFDRCVFTNNRMVDLSKEPEGSRTLYNKGALFQSCVLSSCLVKDNDGAGSRLVYQDVAGVSRVVNSTFVGNLSVVQEPLSGLVAAYGCIFQNFMNHNNITTGGGNVVWPSASTWSAATRVLAFPYLADSSSGAARTVRGSPAENLSPYGDWAFLAAGLRGLDGAFADYADGFATAGCYQDLIDPCHWYVDAAAKDDTADGSTPATAKRTLNGALALAQAGDVVHVAEGVYRENAKRHAENVKIPSAAVLPEGVTLVADGAQANTIIEGRWGGATAETQTSAFQNMTFGEDGVRCIYANAATAIRGFTLRNGGVLNAKNKDGTGAAIVDKTGAGVYGTATTLIEDCLFTNLVANLSAGFAGGCTARRCRFIRLGADGNAVCQGGSLYNCYVDFCFDAPVGAAVVKNCTVGPNCKIGFGQGSAYVNWYCSNPISSKAGDNVVLENVVVMSKSGSATGGLHTFGNAWNCVFVQDNLESKYTVPEGQGNQFVALADIKIDSAGRPQADSPAVDAGRAVDANAAELDLDGNPRIFNRAVDVGCCEYDWRTKYAQDLKGKRIVVTEASPNVVETVGGNVRLTDGCTLDLDWPARSSMSRYEINFELVGTGTLTIKDAAGQTLATFDAAGAQQFAFRNPTADTAFSFAYAGSGSATLGQFVDGVGTLIIFR